MLRVINALSLPLVVLNWVAPIIAIVWLSMLGHWFLVAYGLTFWLLGAAILSFALLPRFALFGVIAASDDAHPHVTKSFVLFAIFSLFVVLSIWCLIHLSILLDNATQSNLVPIVLWFYTVATNPIGSLANKEIQAGEIAPIMTTFFFKFSSVIAMLAILFFHITFPQVTLLFAVSIFSGLLIELKACSGHDVQVPEA